MQNAFHDVFKVLVGIAIPLAAFATGLRAMNSDPLWLARRPGLLLRSLLVILVMVPVGTVLFLEVTGASAVTKAGLSIAIIAVGIGPAAAFKKAKVQQDAETIAYEVGLDVALLALAIAYIPLAVAVHGAIFHHQVRLGVGQVAKVVFLKALIPLIAGTIIGRTASRWVAPVTRYAGRFVQVAMLAVILVALLSGWRGLIAVGPRTWLLCATIVFGEIVVGHAAGGPEPALRRMLVAFSAVRFPALALLLASVARRGHEFLPVILAYLISTVVLVALYNFVTSRRTREARPPLQAQAREGFPKAALESGRDLSQAVTVTTTELIRPENGNGRRS